ncbi:Outer membrane usher protein papC precursor [Serratia fonticola]|uniref:Outer membrane usher protein papC n=1 Tax=Serratia fonticola TaxID=47917 RepID=A0A4U9WP35_SERFO|nr:Outer membrane usher protein papC precursor [Serratia fonticola]
MSIIYLSMSKFYSSVVSKTLTEGAIGYRKIRAIKGQQLMAVIRLQDGSFLRWALW